MVTTTVDAVYTPGFFFRELHADTTIKNLFGESCSHCQMLADSFSFFSDIEVFGLESPIGAESGTGGYFFSIASEKMAWFVEQIRGKYHEKIADNPVWQRISVFSHKLNTDILLREGLHDRVGFEMDICGLPPEIPVPSIFFRVPSNRNSDTVLRKGLEALSVNLAAAQHDLLVKAIRVLGSACSSFELGILLARPCSPLRLNAFSINLPDMLKCLRLLGINTIEAYPGFWQNFHVWAPHASAVNIDIDTNHFGAKVGINFLDLAAVTIRQQQQSNFWPEFLEWLVSNGWCLPHKKQAVLDWCGGYKYYSDPYDLMGAQKAVLRTFSHVKLDFLPVQPPRAKVYLECMLK